MGVLVTALGTAFTPTATAFTVQVVGQGVVALQMRASESDPWVGCRGNPIRGGEGVVVDNPYVGTSYQLLSIDGSVPTVKAIET
jgi:hypothetical protein